MFLYVVIFIMLENYRNTLLSSEITVRGKKTPRIMKITVTAEAPEIRKWSKFRSESSHRLDLNSGANVVTLDSMPWPRKTWKTAERFLGTLALFPVGGKEISFKYLYTKYYLIWRADRRNACKQSGILNNTTNSLLTDVHRHECQKVKTYFTVGDAF